MTDTSANVKIALQVLGISASATLAGASAAQSIIAMPALLVASPPLLAKQFARMYHSSMGLLKPTNAASTLTFAALTYVSYKSSKVVPLMTITQWKLFAVSAASAFSVTPYTIMNLAPINGKMEQLAKKVEAQSDKGLGESGSLSAEEEKEAKTMMAKWTKLNNGRAALPFFAAIVALYASLAF